MASRRTSQKRPTGSGRATMRDVAALAGVSVKTVSRVVNDEPGVTEALSRRVSAAVAELGYRHNLTASHLRRGHRTASIGVLVQDLSNEFCGAVLRAIEDRARAEGVVVIASSIDEDAELERETAHGLVARRIDGLILMPASRHQDYLDTDRASGLAVVAVDRRPLVTDIDAVVADNQGGAAEAVGHLISHGHRRIAFLGRQREHRHRGGTARRLPDGAASVSASARTRPWSGWTCAPARTPPGPRTRCSASTTRRRRSSPRAT